MSKEEKKEEYVIGQELLKFFLENDFVIYWKKDNKSDKKSEKNENQKPI